MKVQKPECGLNKPSPGKHLVLQQFCIDGYRAIQSVQDKAKVAGNGCSLVKTLNAVLGALGCSLRASQKVVIHVVALFVKGTTIPCKVRLVANHFLARCTHQYNVVGVLVKLYAAANLGSFPDIIITNRVDSNLLEFIRVTNKAQVKQDSIGCGITRH